MMLAKAMAATRRLALIAVFGTTSALLLSCRSGTRSDVDAGGARLSSDSANFAYTAVVDDAMAAASKEERLGWVTALQRSLGRTRMVNHEQRLSEMLEAHAWPQPTAILLEGIGFGSVPEGPFLLLRRVGHEIEIWDPTGKTWLPFSAGTTDEARAVQRLVSLSDSEILSMESESGTPGAADAPSWFLAAATRSGAIRQVGVYGAGKENTATGRAVNAMRLIFLRRTE